MIARLILLCWLGLWSSVGLAETIFVRSGDHDGFSRLVLKPVQKADWILGRTDKGYELRLSLDTAEFDASRVFDLISRSRISAIKAAEAPGAIAIEVVDGTHATAFETPAGAIVIDVALGPPPAGSRFEAPLPELVKTAEAVDPQQDAEGDPPDAASDIAATPDEGTALHPETPLGGVAFLPARQPAISYRPAIIPDPRLDLFWREASDVEETAPPPDAPAVLPVVTARQPETVAAVNDPEKNATKHIEFPALPDPKVSELEAHLLAQISRAASQGLIEAAPARPKATAEGEHPEAASDSSVAHVSPGVADPSDHNGLHTETSIDRESRFVLTRAPVTETGGTCLSNDMIDVAQWGDERPYALQISEAHQKLVGEFDMASPSGVEHLARLYLFFGFGAEARAALTAFEVDVADAPILLELARLFELGKDDPESAFLGMMDCDTSAALWAVLAQPNISAGDTVNYGAVLRAFSGFPLHLRKQFGPELSNRFIGSGKPDVARAIRDAIARAPGDHNATVTMIDARIGLAMGDAKGAETLLEKVVADDGPVSPEALIMAIESRLDRGMAVDPKMVETAGAMAFEFRKAAMGPDLARIHILALASAQSFREAFAALDRWLASGAARLQDQTEIELFALLSLPESGPMFLTNYFENRNLIVPEDAPAELRITLAKILLEQGFSEESRRLIASDIAATETGRLFLARASLAEFDAEEALRQLSGLQGQGAMRLRGDALSLLGRYADASAAYLAAEEPDLAGPEAWRAGNWEKTSEIAPEPFKAAVFGLGLAPVLGAAGQTESASVEPDGIMAQNRALLDESRAARAALDALLTATSVGTAAGG